MLKEIEGLQDKECCFYSKRWIKGVKNGTKQLNALNGESTGSEEEEQEEEEFLKHENPCYNEITCNE